MRNEPGLRPDDFEILPGRVKHLGDPLIRHQLVEGTEIETAAERVDDQLVLGAGHLDQAQLGPEGMLPDEFGIDGDKGVPAEARTSFGKLGGCDDRAHERRLIAQAVHLVAIAAENVRALPAGAAPERSVAQARRRAAASLAKALNPQCLILQPSASSSRRGRWRWRWRAAAARAQPPQP